MIDDAMYAIYSVGWSSSRSATMAYINDNDAKNDTLTKVNLALFKSSTNFSEVYSLKANGLTIAEAGSVYRSLYSVSVLIEKRIRYIDSLLKGVSEL